MAMSRRIDRSERAANRCTEGASYTDLLIVAPKEQHLPTRRPPWGPTSFAPMVASSREATVTVSKLQEIVGKSRQSSITLTEKDITVATEMNNENPRIQLKLKRKERQKKREIEI